MSRRWREPYVEQRASAAVDDRQLSLYGGKPPAVAGCDTSEAASRSVAAVAPALREEVYRAIRASADGATSDEIEQRLDRPHQTVSARIRELVQLGRVVDSGARRLTRSKRSARVYRAAGGDR